MIDMSHKYAVLENIGDSSYRGSRFITIIDGRETEEEMTKLETGEVVYKVIMTTDDRKEAESVAMGGRTKKELISDWLDIQDFGGLVDKNAVLDLIDD